jgi:hypothetical protein
MCLQAQKKKFYSFSYFKYAFIIFELLIFIKEVNIVLSHIFIYILLHLLLFIRLNLFFFLLKIHDKTFLLIILFVKI